MVGREDKDGDARVAARDLSNTLDVAKRLHDGTNMGQLIHKRKLEERGRADRAPGQVLAARSPRRVSAAHITAQRPPSYVLKRFESNRAKLPKTEFVTAAATERLRSDRLHGQPSTADSRIWREMSLHNALSAEYSKRLAMLDPAEACCFTRVPMQSCSHYETEWLMTKRVMCGG